MPTTLQNLNILFNDGSTQTTAKPATGTAVASTSGTAIDFTGIPSWVRRITVIFNNVSTNGANNFLVQIGSGGITSSGYSSTSADVGNGNQTATTTSTAGYVIRNFAATNTLYGTMVICLIGSNIYVSSHSTSNVLSNGETGAGGVTLAGVLDRVRITTAGGADTFDGGTINILYE